MSMGTRDGYRPDIDGLRAVAVAAVVAFHAGLGGVPGGFVGVDVFFVISGYLIGGHIFGEIRGAGFAFGRFYARRVRRILPALFVVLLATYLAGLLLLTPLELRELGKEAVPTVFGLSNLLFYTGGGYFAPAADYNPLLMTWSLGVEEQFYLLFPFVMLALSRLRARAELWVLLALSLGSFLASLWMMPRDPSGAFYLLPPRAWELGLGAALAVWERRSDAKALPALAAEVAGIVGATLIVAAILLYRPAYAFPGVFVLLPVLGTVLAIMARGSVVNRAALSSPPVVFLGRISYSWYLWHWPLFFFHRALGGNVHPLILIAVSLVLAVASWRLIETPFRRPVLRDARVLARYAIAAVVMTIPAFAFYASGGLPQRLSPRGQTFAAQARAARADPCLAPYGATAPTGMARCVPGPATQSRLLLIGDSHASALSPGVAQVARDMGLGFGAMTRSSCLPLAGYARILPERRSDWAACRAYQRYVFDWIDAHPGVRVVALAGYWPSGMTVTGDRGMVPLTVALGETIARLRGMGRQVIVIQDVPALRFDPYPRVVGGEMPVRAGLGRALGAETGGHDRAGRDQVFADPARPLIAAVARAQPGVRVIDPHAALCDRGGCQYRSPEALYYFDFQHLTAPGALAAVAER